MAASTSTPQLPPEDISRIRSMLTAERIQKWIDDRKLVPMVISGHDFDGHNLDGRVAIIANSLLQALKSELDCPSLPILSNAYSFTRRVRQYFVDPNIRAAGNYKPPEMKGTVPQLLVLPVGTAADGASISWALRLGNQRHELSEVLGYSSTKRVKLEEYMQVRPESRLKRRGTWFRRSHACYGFLCW
jgi:hypothetical protein